MKKKIMATDFKRMKEKGEKFTFVTAYDYTMASIVDQSDCQIILVGDSLGMVMLGYSTTTSVTLDDIIHHTKPVVLGAPNTHVIADLPFGTYNVSDEQAIINANRIIKETGCDSIKLEGGTEVTSRISSLTEAGIVVIGHIGLTPQKASQLGGFRVQGTTTESALELIESAKQIEKAGAVAIVIECVPSVVAKAITDAVSIPVMGIGAGPNVDCQVLVTQDLLGMYNDFKPKFVKHFANIRNEMVDGLNRFHEETINGSFPSEEYSFNKEVDLGRLY